MLGATIIATTVVLNSIRYLFGRRSRNGFAAFFRFRKKSSRFGIGISIRSFLLGATVFCVGSPASVLGPRTSMPDSPLRECWHKLSRGEEHLNTFNAERQGFLGGDPYSVASEYDAKQSKY